MHRPSPTSRPDPTKLSGVHRKVRRVKKPGWNDTQHDLDEYKSSPQELLEKKLRMMSKEQLMRLAGIAPETTVTQQSVTGHHSNAEAGSSSSGEDKENMRPESADGAVRPSKPTKPASPAVTHTVLPASHPPTASHGRVSVQPAVTAAPIVASEAQTTVQAPAPPPQLAPPLSYRTVLRSAALLSPVLERSIEVELDAEAHADTSIQSSPAGTEQRQQADDAETQQLIARIDTLTTASPPRPQAATQPPLKLTPAKRMQVTVQEVAARMQQLADTPPQLPTFSPPPLPPLTPPHIHPLPSPATTPSTPSIHHRLFLLLKQVAAHLESLSSRQSTDAAERSSLVRQLEAKDREVVQLQAKVQALEGGVMLVQRQLLAMQRGYDEQLAGMVTALARLEQRQAPAAAEDVDAPEPPIRGDGESTKRTFAVPPPFVSSQMRIDQPSRQLVSPLSRRHRDTQAAAALLTPPRSPFASSSMRPSSSASFLASPTPPRAGRSPRRIIARWDEVSNLEQRLQAAVAPNNTQTNQSNHHATHSANNERTMAAEYEEGTSHQDELTGPDLSASASSTFSPVSAESLPTSAKRSGRRSAGWPQQTSGWTVHMR